MTRQLLLDTNLIIQAFDSGGAADPILKATAKQQLQELLGDANVTLAITPLIRYEVLRGVPRSDMGRFNELADVLTQFQTYEIRSVEANLAAELWQYAVSQGNKPIRRSFDIMHVASAKANNLEMISADADIAKLQDLYKEMMN